MDRSWPRRLGGRISLDFANTVEHRHSDEPIDYLTDYQALLRWARGAGALSDWEPLLTEEEEEELSRLPRSETDAAWRRAIVVREALFDCMSGRGDASASSRATLTSAIHDASLASTLIHAGSHIAWQFSTSDPLLPIHRAIEDALALLTSDDMDRVHECPGIDGCGWLFLDTSRGGRRKWCSMQSCGNLAKTRRHRGQPSEQPTGQLAERVAPNRT